MHQTISVRQTHVWYDGLVFVVDGECVIAVVHGTAVVILHPVGGHLVLRVFEEVVLVTWHRWS